jgi:hypothetical protein
MTTEPIAICAVEPGAPASDLYETALRARNDLAMSHELVNFAVPVGLNWNEQSAGSAVTTTGAFFCAAASDGSAVSVSAVNSGKYVTAAIRQPARMTGLRPIRSDSEPKTMNPPVPKISDQAISTFEVNRSILRIACRKNSA